MNCKSRSLSLVLIAVFHVTVFARRQAPCDWDLMIQREYRAERLSLADRSQRRYEGKPIYCDVQRFVADHGLAVLESRPNHFVSVAFSNNLMKEDCVYLLQGSLRGKTFVADRVERTLGGKWYYRALSEARGLTPLEISVQRPILGQNEIIVEGWTQLKLAMKHRLSTEEIARFLDQLTPDLGVLPLEINRHGHHEINGKDFAGQRLRVSILAREDGRLELVTAFRVR